MRALIAIQARLSSNRMPRKVLADLCGKPMLSQMHRRLKVGSKKAFAVVVACPEKDQKHIEACCPGIPVYGGPETDVLSRLVGVAEEYEADTLVRVTGDCPLVCPELIDFALEQLEGEKDPAVNIVQNWRPRTYPDGFDFDAYKMPFLRALSVTLPDMYREYYAQLCMDVQTRNLSIQADGVNLNHYRLTVDYPEDLELVRLIWHDMGDEVWDVSAIVTWLTNHPQEARINQKHYDGNFGEKR